MNKNYLIFCLFCSILLPIVFSCTEPNPRFISANSDGKIGRADGSINFSFDQAHGIFESGFSRNDMMDNCVVGSRKCYALSTYVCKSSANGPTFEMERTCPGGTVCQEGICVPTSPACATYCDANDQKKICTVFVDPNNKSRLDTFCANIVGTKPGEAECKNNDECRSGICVPRTKISVCFKSCVSSRDCLLSYNKCLKVDVTVDGVKGKVSSCVTAN